MLAEVTGGIVGEIIHLHHAVGCLVTVEQPVFGVNTGHSPRFQYPQQMGNQEIHLLPKVIIRRVVAEVVQAGDILIMVAKWNAGHDAID